MSWALFSGGKHKEENQESASSRWSLIERRMLFQRLLAEVQLSKLHSMRVIHVLAVCQYHSHHLPVHHSFASKSLTPLLIYSLNFKVHPVYPRILVFHCAISDVTPSPIFTSSHHILSPLSVCFPRKTSPFLLEIWYLHFTALLHTHADTQQRPQSLCVCHTDFEDAVIKMLFQKNIKLQEQLKLTLVHLWRNLENSRIQHCHTL